jgi:hypothetical protein
MFGNFYPYFIIADKLNQQIILLHSYEYNLLSYHIDNQSFYNKKIDVREQNFEDYFRDFIRDWSKLFKILNKDTYLLSIDKNAIYLISSKYLEIITEYDLKDDFDKCFILNNMNMIFFSFNNRIIIYKYENGELNFYKKKYCKYYEKMIDIKGINEKGDHILAIQKAICKYSINISRLYYIKYNDNLDYPFLSDDNINGYKDELYEFYKHKYSPYESNGSNNSDESDESDESDKFEEFEDLDNSEEYDESDDSNNDDINEQFYSNYDKIYKCEKENEFNFDKRYIKNKKIKELKKIKDTKNQNKRMYKLKCLKKKKIIKYKTFFYDDN